MDHDEQFVAIIAAILISGSARGVIDGVASARAVIAEVHRTQLKREEKEND